MINTIDPKLVPTRQTRSSAGYDIYAVEDMQIGTEFKTFDTGIILNEVCRVIKTEIVNEIIVDEYFGMIVPRSSMGFKHGLRFANTVCIIDKDYNDSIKLSIAANHEFEIEKGTRYAQLIFIPYLIGMYEKQPDAKRSGGIGSTN